MSDESEQGARHCTKCGKPLDRSLSYELWLFHTCRSCYAEPAPRRYERRSFGEMGTAKKWAYHPRWHFAESQRRLCD